MTTTEQIRSIVERYERLEAEKKDIADLQKEVMHEAKGNGFDVPALKAIIGMRKKSPDDLAEEQAVLEMYMHALGMK